MGSLVPFNPADPVQTNFLSTLSSGEGNATYEGYGGTDLTNDPRSATGFPQWAGVTTANGPTHAAGLYQFEPGTWEPLAAQYGLNFSNPSDQAQAAWYLAQQQDPNLYSSLQSGNYASVQQALQDTWPSVNNDNWNKTSGSIPGVGTTTAASGAAGTSGANTGGVTGIPWLDTLIGQVGDIADYPAALATGALGGNTSSPTNGPATAAGAATGAGVNQVATDALTSFLAPLEAWAQAHWIEILVVLGVIALAIVSLGGMFKGSEGGHTTIIPVPV